MIFNFGNRVALSTLFLRSIGGTHRYAETHGTVQWRHDEYGWQLIGVIWDNGEQSSINAKNLVLLKNKSSEARYVEHHNVVPGIVIGSNAFLKLSS